MKQQFIWAGIAGFLVIFAASAWAAIHPAFAVAQLQAYVMRKLNMQLTVKGGTELTFTPKLGIVLNDVMLSNPPGMVGNFATAQQVTLPLKFSDLASRKIRIENISLEGAHFNFVTDAKGRANWNFSKGPELQFTGSMDAPSTSEEPLQLLITSSTANYMDERSGQAFSMSNATGSAEIAKSGEMDVAGTAVLNAQFAKLEMHLGSLQRITRDGSPADIAIRSPALDLNFSGRLGTGQKLALVGTVDAKSADLHALSKWLGNPIAGSAGFKNFSLQSAVDANGNVFTFNKANIAMDGMQAKGSMTADFSSKVPQVSATLSTDRLDLNSYLQSKPGAATPKSKAEEGWSVTPFNFGALKTAEGEISISAYQVKWKNAEWGPVELKTTLKNGALNLSLSEASLFGGKANAKIQIDANQDAPSFQLDFSGHELAGKNFFEKLADVNWLEGVTAITASLAGAGKNQQELMSDLKGSFQISVANGRLKGIDILDDITRVSTAILKGWADAPGQASDFESATASFALADGVATTQDFTLESPLLSISGTGQIDMLRQAVNLKFDPRLRAAGGETPRLPVAIVVKGDWHAPRIYPDVDGVSEKDVKKIEKTGKKLLKKLFGN